MAVRRALLLVTTEINALLRNQLFKQCIRILPVIPNQQNLDVTCFILVKKRDMWMQQDPADFSRAYFGA